MMHENMSYLRCMSITIASCVEPIQSFLRFVKLILNMKMPTVLCTAPSQNAIVLASNSHRTGIKQDRPGCYSIRLRVASLESLINSAKVTQTKELFAHTCHRWIAWYIHLLGSIQEIFADKMRVRTGIFAFRELWGFGGSLISFRMNGGPS
jgi:hypothetical protein